jgi:Glycoside hydrolase 123, catalytic domain/Glycoside hydrolase 123 N-terminal domain
MSARSLLVTISVVALSAGMLRNTIAAVGAAAPFDFFATSDLVRVFEDGYGAPDTTLKEVRLSGLRAEVLSGQCVIRAREDMENVSVSISPLKRATGGAVIPAAGVAWHFVDAIHIEANTPKLVKSDLTRPAPAWFPDALSDDRRRSVGKGTSKAVYLTVRVPRDAEPGEYRGEVTATAGLASAVLPLLLTVYPLTLPEQRHVMVTEWFSTGRFKQFHGVDPADPERFYPMLRVYAENMADHRQNVFQAGLDLIASTRAAGGKLRFDFARFDRWADVFWSTGRMDLLETGFVARFGPGGWSGSEINLRDFSVRDETTGERVSVPGKQFLPELLPALVAHLRAKGWLEKTVFHICDEPSNHNVMAFREASDFVHRYAPELRRLDAIETTHCRDRLEIWVPKLDHLATWQSAFEQAQREGNELWFYTVGIFQNGSLPNKTVDVPLIESRLMHWLNYRYGLRGYLHWGFNVWTDDPWRAPGQHRGDGWHVYPKAGGLLDSLRWEQMRNGLQDYECLWLLESKIGQVQSTLSPRVAELIEPSRRGVEIAAQVVRTYSDYTRDPAVLYAARQQAIEETLGLETSPRVLLQTNPPEYESLASDCAVDVYGWAEPGTRIKVNGQQTPVAEDGLFTQQVSPSRAGSITVDAEGAAGHKLLVRKFKLLH